VWGARGGGGIKENAEKKIKKTILSNQTNKKKKGSKCQFSSCIYELIKNNIA